MESEMFFLNEGRCKCVEKKNTVYILMECIRKIIYDWYCRSNSQSNSRILETSDPFDLSLNKRLIWKTIILLNTRAC